MPDGLPSSKIKSKKSFKRKVDESTVPNSLILLGTCLSFSQIKDI